jgi:excisionase family DNA binding protein
MEWAARMSAHRAGFRIPEDLLLPWSPRETISVATACRMLDCGHNVVSILIEEGKIKAYKMRPDKPNSPWRIQYDSVIAYLEEVHAKSGLDKRF